MEDACSTVIFILKIDSDIYYVSFERRRLFSIEMKRGEIISDEIRNFIPMLPFDVFSKNYTLSPMISWLTSTSMVDHSDNIPRANSGLKLRSRSRRKQPYKFRASVSELLCNEK